MAAPSALEDLVTPPLEAMGYDVVRVLLTGGRNPTLQVMAERRDGRPMTVDDCQAISRDLSAILDVEDPIDGTYVLEVSSPGIDRPLTRPGDFERFKGFEARIELKLLTEGRRRFKARIAATEDDRITFDIEGEPFTVDHSLIQKAKLVMTDELIAARAAEAAGSEQTVEGSPID